MQSRKTGITKTEITKTGITKTESVKTVIPSAEIERAAKTAALLRRALVGIGICCISLWLAGCADGVAKESENVPNAYMAGSMEETPVVDYLVPQTLPGVLTDRRGYAVRDVKKAFVTGRELPETFAVVNAETGETAYYGTVREKAYNAELERYVGYLDFSRVKEPGSYYVECDMIGQSYRFEIKERFYPELFQENYRETLKACEGGSLSVRGAIRFLGAYEWCGEIFPDQNRNSIPDVLEKLQGWVTYMEENGAGAGQEALYAAFLAKFSYNYKDYNYQYATECLKRAATVFGQATDAPDGDADSFYALTELFRATGLNTYRNRIAEYKGAFEDDRTYLEQESYLYGSMTYLMTRQKVDAELCEVFMYTVMNKGEEIIEQYWNMVSPAAWGTVSPDDLMKYAADLSCANHILNNYQYTNVIEEFLHYFMGRNPESVNFYENAEDRSGYLLLFAQLASTYENMAGTE